MTGQTIAHYNILAKLGEGGMGVVYKAEDTNLDRTVALKFLASHLVSNEDHRRRFIREAKAAAALTHPNICTVYEIGEAEGRIYISMAYLEGQEVADLVADGAMEVDRVTTLGIQFADGLAEAHSKGVIHRDIKPANLFVTTQNRGVILDFGLAQLVSADSRLTREGTTLGTVAYMSPEQTTGEEIDVRTDVWALGCVFYEMLAGHPPFEGHYEQAIIYSILNEEPDPLSIKAPELESIIKRCLAKAAADRYPSAAELFADLKALQGGSRTSRAVPAVEPPAEIPSVAVLPFENRGRDEDDEYFSDGVTEDIISALAKIDGLRVTPRTSAFYFKGRGATIAEIAEKLHVGSVLTGGVRRAGNRLRITAELIRVQDETQMWSERYDRVLEDVFDIQDEISRAIAEALEAKLAPRHWSRSATHAQRSKYPDIEAYRHFLQGRYDIYNLDESGIRKGISRLDSARSMDSGYLDARAARGFGLCMLAIMGFERPTTAMEQARAEALRILEIDETVSEAHKTLGFVRHWYDWDFPGAQRSFNRSIELNSLDALTYSWLGLSLGDSGRMEEAIDAARTSVEIDPLCPIANRNLCYLQQSAGDFEAGLEQGRETLEMAPTYVPVMWQIASALYHLGRTEEMLEVAASAVKLAPEDPATLGIVGLWQGAAGNREDAMAKVRKIEQLRKKGYCCASPIAWAYLGTGDLDRTFEWLETALEERDPLLTLIRHFPWPTESFRQDPRFDDLWNRVGPPDSKASATNPPSR